jgi:DNA-binding IclR family transcriptional regulator|tara:strand:+ start:86 stop:298 length:213 start_codon:yes stop_codon:yes gene_type:complete
MSAIDQVLALLYELGDEVGTRHVAIKLDMSLTTAQRSLARLREEGWVSGRRQKPVPGTSKRTTTVWRVVA